VYPLFDRLGFDWLFVQTSDIDLEEPYFQDCLIRTVFVNEHNLFEIKGAWYLMPESKGLLLQCLLELLAALFEKCVFLVMVSNG
jgi:hypothetical protein